MVIEVYIFNYLLNHMSVYQLIENQLNYNKEDIELTISFIGKVRRHELRISVHNV